MTGVLIPLIFVVLLLHFSDTTGSVCSDAAESKNIPYIRMCEDDSVTSDQVILDAHNAALTGETTCSCTVNATLIFSIYVQQYGIGLNPNTSGCGSKVLVSDTITTGVRKRSFTCNIFPEQIINSPPMTITWSGGLCGDSKYCVNITGHLLLPNTTFTITCSKPATPTTEQPLSSPSTSTTSQTTSTSATITTTTTQDDVTSHGLPTDVDMNTKSVTEINSPAGVSTKTSDFHHSVEEEGSMCLPVPAFAAIIVLMCLILLYATVITLLYVRRYCTSDKQQKQENTTGTTPNITTEGYVNMPLPTSSDRTYEGLQLSHVDLSTNTYEVLGNSGT